MALLLPSAHLSFLFAYMEMMTIAWGRHADQILVDPLLLARLSVNVQYRAYYCTPFLAITRFLDLFCCCCHHHYPFLSLSLFRYISPLFVSGALLLDLLCCVSQLRPDAPRLYTRLPFLLVSLVRGRGR